MSLAAIISPTGIQAPSYENILAVITANYRAIFGSDAVLTPDSQDGQLLAIFAQAVYDCNAEAVAVYNQFSPATAQGVGLSSVVKINGIARLVASRSTAIVTITGQVGTIITNGIVGDDLGLNTQWALPASVIIPVLGTIDVTAMSTVEGDITAAAGSLSQILTPTLGWQTVNNPADATPGAPVESDATLRQRQTVSTSLPALSVLDAILGAVANLTGVIRYAIYENDTDVTDADGIPEHSIAVVVEGGDVQEIGETIASKKTPGTGTYGTTPVLVIDPKGVPNTINYFELTLVQIDVVVDITALTGYVSTTEDLIKAAIALSLNRLAIGEDSYTSRLYSPANLSGDAATDSSGFTQAQLDALSRTYNITALEQAVHLDPPGTADIPILFNEAAACVIANITINVT